MTQILEYKLGSKFQWLKEYDNIVKWLNNNEGKGLLCMGNCGRGKTLICRDIIPPIIKYKCERVISTNTMQQAAKNLDELLEKKLIGLDDVGTECISVRYGERRIPFAELVDNAERNNGLLIITTNLTAAELAEKYGERTLDRLKVLTKLVHFEGESLRG